MADKREADGAAAGERDAKRARADDAEAFWDAEVAPAGSADPATAVPEVRVTGVDMQTLMTMVSSLKPECTSSASQAIPLRAVNELPMAAADSPFGRDVVYRDEPGALTVHEKLAAKSSGIDSWSWMCAKSGYSYFRVTGEVSGLAPGEERTVWVSAGTLFHHLKTYKDKGTATLVFGGDAVADRVILEIDGEGDDEEMQISFRGMDADVDDAGSVLADAMCASPEISVRMAGASFCRKLEALDVAGEESKMQLHRYIVNDTQRIGLYFIADNNADCSIIDGFTRTIGAADAIDAFDFRPMADALGAAAGKKKSRGKGKAPAAAEADAAAAAPYDVEAEMMREAEDAAMNVKKERTKHSTFKAHMGAYVDAVAAKQIRPGEPLALPNRLFREEYTLLMNMSLTTKELAVMFKKLISTIEPCGVTILISPDPGVPIFVLVPTATSLSIHMKAPKSLTE